MSETKVTPERIAWALQRELDRERNLKLTRGQRAYIRAQKKVA